ncbi:hypothetical protein J4573_11465 [Actinomadura barringtoniae]|uniref:EthD family reductase n=1 Tax=Actinomadura barringtoniae TaxID=1427535 RepID=A0A939PEF3_9ACTN|nr:hypothetical protein [Actinomadura barringtoniae]MBO2447709.1 hypothetical protein [Actinomadura barringtoniae]
MPKGILYVESRPGSPEQAAAYHEWYNDTHMREMAGIKGIVSARRFAPLGDDGPFVAIYEIDAEDLEAVRAQVADAGRSGTLSPPVGVATDPPPTIRYFREIHTV